MMKKASGSLLPTGLKSHLLVPEPIRPSASNVVLFGLGRIGTAMTERRAHGARLIDEHAQESLMGNRGRPVRAREEIRSARRDDYRETPTGPQYLFRRGSAGRKRARTAVQADAGGMGRLDQKVGLTSLSRHL